MAVFAIADLHLPGGDENKSMDVFGELWEGHFARIQADWRSRVAPGDLVLIPGDISWAMHMKDAMADLRAIAELPGEKLLLKGNHDFWWNSVTALREALPEGMHALQNDAFEFGDTVFCGSRGWVHPQGEDGEDLKIYRRELIRMEMSLERAERTGKRKIVLTHFPPLDEQHMSTPMSELIASYHPTDVVYGHIHGPALKSAFTGLKEGIFYHCVSCDGLQFHLRRVCPNENA